jgi:predicted nucleic acid-binding protein
MSRVFVDTGVLIRYFAEDDPPRALAAARLIDSDTMLVLSTGVLIELVHALRTQHGMANPAIGNALIRFLSRPNIQLSDASRGQVIAALMWSLSTSARRIPDAIIAKAAEASGVDYIATFDERMSSPGVPVRLI